MKRRAVLWALIGLMFGAGAFGNNAVVLQSRSFPGNLKEDGFWAGLYAARDGKVYIGLNTEGGGSAQFYIYRPETDQIRHRADMSEFFGERGLGIRTHAKIHTKFCEDSEGRIYFATGNMGAGPAEVDPRSWKGGHWCRYDPRSDTLEDLGLIGPQNGVYGLTIDPVRMRLYGTSEHGHFLIFDIARKTTTDKGRVHRHPPSVARTIVIDDRGNVYGGYSPNRIFKYDVEKDKLLDLSVQIPFDPTAVEPTPISITKSLMRAGVWDPVTRRLYGIDGSSSYLFEYDPDQGPEGQARKLASLRPENLADRVRRAHYASLSFAFGKDRKFYYLPVGLTESPEDNAGIEFDNWMGHVRLVTYDLTSAERRDLGPVVTGDGMRVVDFLNRAPSGGAATGPDNTVYFCGFVEEKDPAKAGYIFGNLGGRLRLLIYHPAAGNNKLTSKRGPSGGLSK
jgi:hypothetical protein